MLMWLGTLTTFVAGYHAAIGRALPTGHHAAVMQRPISFASQRTPAMVSMAAGALDAAALVDVNAGALPRAPKTNAVSRAFFGGLFVFLTTLVVSGIYPLVLSAAFYGRLFDNKRRRANDFVVQWWARTTMTLFGSQVTIQGVENLPPPDEAVMYVPNHCSFLDIFSLSGYLPRRFKYATPPCGS
jgi:1-acyl-sn-glycerol-3-phosphate acyltransferase